MAGVGWAVAAQDGDDGRLPLTGTFAGTEWRLSAARPPRDDDAPPPSWCLRLRYEPIEVATFAPEDDDAGVSCGTAPAPRVSGTIDVECGSGAAFVYGGMRRGVERLVLRPRRGPAIPARLAALPRRAGFTGWTFAIVADVDRFPARLVARGAGRRVVARWGRRSSICPPGSAGGESWSFAEFASDR